MNANLYFHTLNIIVWINEIAHKGFLVLEDIFFLF